MSIVSSVTKTTLPKVKEIKKSYILIDAKDLVLGRLASKIVNILIGKNKPSYTPHMDTGDNVIVINARLIGLTGNKKDLNTGKRYYRHTNFPGGVKEITAGRLLASEKPEEVLKKAVFGMLTRNTLNRKRMKNLFIYEGNTHPHAAQKPIFFDFAKENVKNIVKF
ncbi:MAG: 50S ribosomal protein L13 [Rickettsiales bacterium]